MKNHIYIHINICILYMYISGRDSLCFFAVMVFVLKKLGGGWGRGVRRRGT